MSGATEAEKLYAAIEESARSVGADCSRDDVLPTLTAFADGITAQSGVVFSAQTGEGPAELEYTVQVTGIDDPYARARAAGFVPTVDHPVNNLLADLRRQVRIGFHAIDCGVTGGFKKIYALLTDAQSVPQLAAIPSMPAALTENASFFDGHGLERTPVLGIDYQNRTMNVYFQLPTATGLEPEGVLAMLREIGLPDPDEEMLAFACTAYRVYTTLSWDSPRIQRISFAPKPRRGIDFSALPAPIEPGIEKFMRSAPHTYSGERICASVVKWSPDRECLDLGSYYQISDEQLRALTAARTEQV
ncbi:aromatic prenyltransferase [Streptomyces fructofermentans]|uniref:Prenyltransferase n=1 Tax=Streptomyces fructofermentans TaxID=152141 RepID=A0A918NTB0_9ACTN|nr:aromatic prenyltransferase [Streptomyces fructofermentans]GGX93627.1 hypothetical protein GCM10010515_70670 [Streptomyces fructofermentans]